MNLVSELAPLHVGGARLAESEAVPELSPELANLVNDSHLKTFKDELLAAPSASDIDAQRSASGQAAGASSRDDETYGEGSGNTAPPVVWEELHSHSKPGIRYRFMRRAGPAPGTDTDGKRPLVQFRMECVMEGVTAEQLADVQLDDSYR